MLFIAVLPKTPQLGVETHTHTHTHTNVINLVKEKVVADKLRVI